MMPEIEHCRACRENGGVCIQHWYPNACPCFKCQIWDSTWKITFAIRAVWEIIPPKMDEHLCGPLIFVNNPPCQTRFHLDNDDDDDTDPRCTNDSDYRCSRCNKTYCANCFAHYADMYVKSTECSVCAVELIHMGNQ